jgi:flagellar assembly factor FliW
MISKCLTKYHGEIEYSESDIVHFESGPFGFEANSRYVLLVPPAMKPLVFLQSLSTPGLCFLTLPILVVDRNYKLTLRTEDRKAAMLPTERQPVIGEDVLCLAILTLQHGHPATANLMAPVVVNLENRKAVQAISSEGSYSHRYVFTNAAAACS